MHLGSVRSQDKGLHREHFDTQHLHTRRFYTEKLLHREAWHTETFIPKKGFTYRSFYIQKF